VIIDELLDFHGPVMIEQHILIAGGMFNTIIILETFEHCGEELRLSFSNKFPMYVNAIEIMCFNRNNNFFDKFHSERKRRNYCPIWLEENQLTNSKGC